MHGNNFCICLSSLSWENNRWLICRINTRRYNQRYLLLDAIPHFEFPRINLYDYVVAEAIKPVEEVNEETDFVLSEAAKGHVVIENSSFSMELS